MVNERPEYVALREVFHEGRVAYNSGDEVSAQVAADLGLELGTDVAHARPTGVHRPAPDASRREWVDYALAQGARPADVDLLGRDDLVKAYAEDSGDDDVPAGTVDEVLRWVGDDETRAAMALAAERGRARPRSGVLDPLRALLGGEPDDSEE